MLNNRIKDLKKSAGLGDGKKIDNKLQIVDKLEKKEMIDCKLSVQSILQNFIPFLLLFVFYKLDLISIKSNF